MINHIDIELLDKQRHLLHSLIDNDLIKPEAKEIFEGLETFLIEISDYAYHHGKIEHLTMELIA